MGASHAKVVHPYAVVTLFINKTIIFKIYKKTQ